MNFNSLIKLRRFKQIVSILMKYGFDELVQQLDLPGLNLIKRVRSVDSTVSTYQRIRHALEDLGPTFVKFGQILSLRPDMLPAELVLELGKLQDDVAPLAFDEIREAVENTFGESIKKTFSVFDAAPLASASISQVHRGTLRKEGVIACVKIQRPGIRKIIEADLGILESIALLINQKSDELKSHDLPNLVRVIRRNLLRELDFTREARNMKIARGYAAESDTYIPEVYDDYCSEQLLVTEFIQGVQLKDIDSIGLEDPEALAKQGLKTAIKQILEDGFFHADPHPANLLIMENDKLALIDWGMVGRLTEKDRFELIGILKSVVEKDSSTLVNALLNITKGKKSIDFKTMERDLLDILDTYHAVPIKDINIGHLLMAIMALLQDYQLKLPTDLVIMIKALVTAEGSARQIYPDLNVVSASKEYIEGLRRQSLMPGNLWRMIRHSISQFLTQQKTLPHRFARILEKFDDGELTLRFAHTNLSGFLKTLESIFNRLTFGIIVGAMIIGSSMIITTGVKPFILGFPALGVIGYLISALFGLWILISIIRNKNY
ncbi:MAG: AarF/UbiB family protein [Desulfobacterales bacterium]